MPPVDSRDAAKARASKRLATSITGVTHAFATGIVTLAAGFLDDLQPGDIVQLSGLTGGTGVPTSTDLYLLKDESVVGSGALFLSGATTCKLSLTPDGAPVLGSSNITAGTITKGKAEATGGLAGDYGPSPLSARGR